MLGSAGLNNLLPGTMPSWEFYGDKKMPGYGMILTYGMCCLFLISGQWPTLWRVAFCHATMQEYFTHTLSTANSRLARSMKT